MSGKNKKCAKLVADYDISGCMAFVVNVGDGVSRDLFKLFTTASDWTVLGPVPAAYENTWRSRSAS